MDQDGGEGVKGGSSFAPKPYSAALQSGSAASQTGDLTQANATALSLLDQSLERTGAKSNYLSQYWNFLLPNNGQPFTPGAVRYSTTGWMDAVEDMSQRHDGVRLGLLFNALALVGQRTGQASVIAEAWRMYSRALHTLARSLPHAGDSGTAATNDDELLMTSALLGAFELLQVSEGRQSWLHGMTWLRHAYGQKAIIVARGPERYVDGHAHQLFADSRLYLSYPDIHHRKRSVFNSWEWKSIPWSKVPKSPKDELVDVLLEIPGLLEDLDPTLATNHVLTTQEKSDLREQLLARCHLYDAQLQHWSTNSGAAVLAFAESHISSLDTSQEPTPSSPSPDGFAMTHLGLIYYATCVLLYEVTRHLAGGAVSDERTDPWAYCRKILLTVPFFLRPAMGAIFLNFVLFPVGVVAEFLARQEEEVGAAADPLAYEEVRGSLQGIFHNQHGGSQLRAFLESWPWRNAGVKRLVAGRAEARIK